MILIGRQDSGMRAGRLVSLLLILQRRGRVTAAALARELEVSERTVLRDIEELSGAGVPVYATRGPGGGFQLLDGFRVELNPPGPATAVDRRASAGRRARVRVSTEGRRLAAVMQVLQPLRVSRGVAPDADGRVEATFRIRSTESTIIDLLSLGPEVEVLAPVELRQAVAMRVRDTARLYGDP